MRRLVRYTKQSYTPSELVDCQFRSIHMCRPTVEGLTIKPPLQIYRRRFNKMYDIQRTTNRLQD
jgi:hypothetical protein